MKNIQEGFCQCGCGGKVGTYKQTRPKKGIVKGELQKYIHGHNSVLDNNPFWKGGIHHRGDGYIEVAIGNSDVKMEHVTVCEGVLGKKLPKGAVIHHVNKKRNENFHENLVICENRAYHLLLHKRMRALAACGHADWDMCTFCKQYDDPKNITQSKYGQKYHNQCRNLNQRTRRRIKKEELLCTL